MDRSNRLKKKYHQCSEQQETDQINYIKAKNDPMTEPKSLAESSQAAEKSKKISEDARKEYQNHLEKAKEEHPMLIKKIQDCYKELQRLEWERLSSVAMVLEIVVENVWAISFFFLFFFFLFFFFLFLFFLFLPLFPLFSSFFLFFPLSSFCCFKHQNFKISKIKFKKKKTIARKVFLRLTRIKQTNGGDGSRD